MSEIEAVVAVLVVGMVVGLPMFGVVLRFALKPVIDAFIAVKQSQHAQHRGGEVDALRLRVAALEAVWEHRLGGGTLEAQHLPGVQPVERIQS